MAAEGKGEVEYVTLNEDGTKAAKKFYERVRTPLLTDLSIDWNGMPVADVYPNKLTDLFSAKPVIVHGRYTKGASGTIKLKGKIAGLPYEREIKLDLPDSNTANDSLASLWARTRVDELSSNKTKPENTAKAPDIDREIASIGLEYGLLTDFTSFVAVEDRIVNRNGTPTTVQVPVELPEGVNRATTVGVGDKSQVDEFGQSLPLNGRNMSQLVIVTRSGANTATGKAPTKRKSGSGRGQGSGIGYGSGGAAGSGTAPKPSATPKVNVSAGVTSISLSGTSVADGPPPPTPNVMPTALTAEQLRDQNLKSKLHGWLYTLVTRLDKKDSSPGPNEAAFVREGKAAIRIELSDASPETLEKLKALGFELTSQKDETVTGQIAIEKLAALAALDVVKLILPKL